jgi:hypothetical protein
LIVAIHGILVSGALGDQNALDAAWETLAQRQLATGAEAYPLVQVQIPFDRALIAVIYGQDTVGELAPRLPIGEYRGLSHLTAANSRAVRKSPFILPEIESKARSLGWKRSLDVTALRRRCRSFERLLLPIAGTLFGVEKRYG